MSQDFVRRLDGYNRPWSNDIGVVSLIRGASITLTFPAGPGRIEAIILVVDDTTNTWTLNALTITLDGVTYWGGGLDALTADYTTSGQGGPHDGSSMGSVGGSSQMACKLDYETSASIVLKNTASPDPTGMEVFAYGRLSR